MCEGSAKILVIDDQKETREIIAGILMKKGYDVLMAPGGREGIALAKMKSPDLILLDMIMPHFSGIETCRALKRIAVIKDIPVIFLTANKNQEDVVAAIKSGGVDYVVKPFKPDDLISRVDKALADKQKKDVNRVIKMDEDSIENAEDKL